jgi:PhnB protein
MTARRNASARRTTTTARKRRTSRPRQKTIAATTPALRARTETSGLAPGMQSVNTYLSVENVAASMDFLERAFGFSRGVVLTEPGGPARYAEMRHGNSVVMLIPKGDQTAATGGTAALYTYVEDVDRLAARAREAGGGVNEAEDKPWGDRVATVTDPDGYRWMLATFKKLVPFT